LTFCGTAEAVPFQSMAAIEVYRRHVKASGTAEGFPFGEVGAPV
jgi:hypothetical protein